MASSLISHAAAGAAGAVLVLALGANRAPTDATEVIRARKIELVYPGRTKPTIELEACAKGLGVFVMRDSDQHDGLNLMTSPEFGGQMNINTADPTVKGPESATPQTISIGPSAGVMCSSGDKALWLLDTADGGASLELCSTDSRALVYLSTKGGKTGEMIMTDAAGARLETKPK
jgi:hypothetical protein